MASFNPMRAGHSLFRLVAILFDLAQDVLRLLLLGTRSTAALKAENMFLRKQLALYLEREVKPRRATDAMRLSMVLFSRFFAWQNALVNVKPETFLSWHRKGFRLLWRWKSRPRGRPRVPTDLQELIVKMAQENPSAEARSLAAAQAPCGRERREFCVRAALGRFLCRTCSGELDQKLRCAMCQKRYSNPRYVGLIFHDLRRSGVRNLDRAGVPQHVAIKISGHKTDSVYRRFNITSCRDLREAAKRVNAYVSDRISQTLVKVEDEQANDAIVPKAVLQ